LAFPLLLFHIQRICTSPAKTSVMKAVDEKGALEIRKLFIVFCAALVVFGGTGIASAGLIEGFEGDTVGSPPSWASTWIGNVTVETGSGFASGSISATEGDSFLYLTTGPEVTGAGQSTYDRDGDGEFEYDIALMSMSFTAPEGWIISFDFDVLTEEILGGVADIFEIRLDGSTVASGAIGYASGSFPAAPGFSAVLITGPRGSSYEDGRLGWSNVSIAVGSSGQHTLEFYVGDSGDGQVDTAVLVDNIQTVAPSSEPMPVGNAGGGGCFIGTAADPPRR
jgi:hypothetical protein